MIFRKDPFYYTVEMFVGEAGSKLFLFLCSALLTYRWRDLLAYSSLTENQNYWKNRISRVKKTISQVVSSKMFTTEVKDKLVVMTRMAYKPITSHWSRVREDSLSPFMWDVQRCRNSNFANSLISSSMMRYVISASKYGTTLLSLNFRAGENLNFLTSSP